MFTVRLYPVVCFETLQPECLLSVANNVQRFAQFELGETLEEVTHEQGEYLHEEALEKLESLTHENRAAGRLGCMGITSVKLDTQIPVIAKVEDRFALASDFDWQQEPELYDESYRWLYTILQVASAFICGNRCGVPSCVCNVDASFSLSTLVSTRVCEDCKKAMIDLQGLGLLNLVEEAISNVRGLVSSGYSMQQLIEFDAEHLKSIGTHACEQKVNETWIREWLARNLPLNEARTNPFPLLPSRICESAMSQGLRPDWADPVINAVANSRHIDTLLYLTRKRHRDHSRHQFYVASIGLFFLDAKVGQEESLKEDVLRTLSMKYHCGLKDAGWDDNKLMQSWIVAALLHDSGYPLSHMLEVVANICHEEADASSVDFSLIESVLHQSQFVAPRWTQWVSRIRDRINSSKRPSHGEVLNELLKDLSSSCRLCFGSTSAEGYQNGLPAGITKMLSLGASREESREELIFDHGLWSAVNLIELLCASHWSFEPMKPHGVNLALVEALEAMALHNVSPRYYKIDFRQNPLACLLRFCDEIQEWNRGTLTRGKFFEETDHIVLSPVTELAGDTYVGKEIKVRFEYGRELLDTDWDIRKFIQSKESLCIFDFPLSVTFEIALPFGISSSPES